MLKKRIIFLIAAMSFFALTFPGQVFGGAWTQHEGGMYNKFQFNYYWATQTFDKNGKKFDSGGKFEDKNFTYYGEYGLKDNLTVITSIPVKQISNHLDTGDNTKTTGVGDIDLALKYRLYKGESAVISIQGLVKIPEAYDKNRALPLGNGQYDVEARLLLGKSLYPLPLYFGLEAGYRFRFQAPADEFKLLAELGYSVTDKLYLRTKVDATLSAQNSDKVAATELNPTLSLDYNLIKWEFTAGYRISKALGVEFTYTPDVWGKNIAAGRNLQLALFYMF